MQESNRRRGGPEVRLLLATIAISAVALLLLARLRFPEAPPTPELIVTPPLERLAATATYDELAGIVAGVQARIGPSLLALRLTRLAFNEPPLDSTLLSVTAAGPTMTTGIRLSDTTALAYLPEGVGPPVRLLPGGEPVELVAVDEIRGLALLRVPRGPAIVPRASRNFMVDVPAYLAAAEPTVGGAAMRPVFIARSDARADARWGSTLYSLSIQGSPPGSPLFSLGGEFMGLLVATDEGIALLPAPDVSAEVARLQQSGSVRRGRPGFSVQPLTTPLASATGATSGVVVTLVDPGGPAAGLLRVGDVIEQVGEQAVPDIDAFVATISGVAAGTPLVLSVLREGTRSQVVITPGNAPAEAGERGLGLILRTLRGAGAEVVLVVPGSAGSRAGLRAGDVVTHLNGVENPTAADIDRAWSRAKAPLALGVRRGIQPLVLALPAR
jgi:S1-C subfamily serine protease